MDYFQLTRPTVAELPIVVEVPHAGLIVPDSVRKELISPPSTLLRDADPYVDRICANVADHGAILLSALVSRQVVDLNRAADDVDGVAVAGYPRKGGPGARGVVWRSTTLGEPILEAPITRAQFAERIAKYHAPYHGTLDRLVSEVRTKHGHAIVLAVHSMPSSGRASTPPFSRGDAGQRRADVVPGTQGMTSAAGEVIAAIEAHFRGAGLSVRHDDPYRGGWTTQHHGRPERGVHAIQLELNRALYLDEQTYAPNEAGVAHLAELINGLVERLGGLKLGT